MEKLLLESIHFRYQCKCLTFLSNPSHDTKIYESKKLWLSLILIIPYTLSCPILYDDKITNAHRL